MTKIFKLVYVFFVGLFWIATFGFGSTAVVSLIYVCFREFGKAKTFGIYCWWFLVASVVSVLLGIVVDVIETKYKTRRW